MFKFTLFVLLGGLATNSSATSFYPVSYEKLLRSTDGVFVGHFLGKKSIELEDGTLATQMRFKVSESNNLPIEQLETPEIKVFYPGGQLKGKAQLVEGVPDFSSGEQVAILLKEGQDGRYWGVSLGMGSFRVVKMGQQFFMINTIFPNNTILSQMSLDMFRGKVKEVKGSGLIQVSSDKYSLQARDHYEYIQTKVKNDNGNYRTIASVSTGTDSGREPNVMSSFWLLFILSLLGLVAGILATTKRSRGKHH